MLNTAKKTGIHWYTKGITQSQPHMKWFFAETSTKDLTENNLHGNRLCGLYQKNAIEKLWI